MKYMRDAKPDETLKTVEILGEPNFLVSPFVRLSHHERSKSKKKWTRPSRAETNKIKKTGGTKAVACQCMNDELYLGN